MQVQVTSRKVLRPQHRALRLHDSHRKRSSARARVSLQDRPEGSSSSEGDADSQFPFADRLRTIRNWNVTTIVATITTIVWISASQDGPLSIPILGGISKTALALFMLVAVPSAFELKIRSLESDDPRDVKDPGLSSFTAVKYSDTDSGDPVTVHWQQRKPKSPASRQADMHLYHGFGANLWSWQFVQQPLADHLGGVVTAHDQCGFGLTVRSRDIRAYDPECNGRVGMNILDKAAGAGAASKRILMAHSVGCLGLMEAVLAESSKVHTIIFVDPVLGRGTGGEAATPDPQSVTNIPVPGVKNPRKVWLEEPELVGEGAESARGKRSKRDGTAAPAGAQKPPNAVVSAIADPIFFILRIIFRLLLRLRSGWALGLRLIAAGNAVPDAVLNRYRQPILVSDWEGGIMLFTIAQVAYTVDSLPIVGPALFSFFSRVFVYLMDFSQLVGDSQARRGLLKASGLHTSMTRAAGTAKDLPVAVQSVPDQISALRKKLKENGIDMYVINGSKDIIAPLATSRWLAAELGVPLVVVDGVGHTPAEEAPEEFMAIIRKLV